MFLRPHPNFLIYAPDDSAGGDTEDWEARFKGLQRKFNELQSKYEKAESTIEGARTQAAEIQQRYNELETQLKSATKDHEKALAEATATITKLTTEHEQASTRAAQFEQEKAAAQKKLNIVSALAKPEFSDLYSFYENGFLTGVEDLEGDELKTRLESFRSLLGSRTTQALDEVLKTSTPPTPPITGSGSTNYAQMSTQDIASWLMKPGAVDHQDYDAVHTVYLDRVKKEQQR